MSASSKKRIRLGFIGVGNMGQAAHLRNYASLNEECEVVALAELRPEMAAKVAARYGIPEPGPDGYRGLAAADISETFIEIQVWSDEPVRGYLSRWQ